MPKVSVVIPNYNHARYLRRRLDSVFAQTLADREVIVCDDASTDDSRAVIEAYAAQPGVRCLWNAAPSGSPFVQWNRGVREARGEYVWIAESDDYADPRLLEVLVARLEAHPSAGIAYCRSWQVDEEDRAEGLAAKHIEFLPDRRRWDSDYVNDGKDEIGKYLVQTCSIPNASAAVFRRALYEQIGGADERMRMAGDYLTWAKMLMRSDIAYVAEPLNFYRWHRDSVRSTIDEARARREIYAVLCYLAANAGAIEAASAGARARIAEWLFRRWGSYFCLAERALLPGLERDLNRMLQALACRIPRAVRGLIYTQIVFSRHASGDADYVRKYFPKAALCFPPELRNRRIWFVAAGAFLRNRAAP